jgi:hypothetical protein
LPLSLSLAGAGATVWAGGRIDQRDAARAAKAVRRAINTIGGVCARADATSMIIVVGDAGELTLTDESNFKELSLQMPSAASSSDAATVALASAGVDLQDGYAWFPADWLLSQRPAPEWQSSVRGILDAVERFGWYDRESDRVRVHIER